MQPKYFSAIVWEIYIIHVSSIHATHTLSVVRNAGFVDILIKEAICRSIFSLSHSSQTTDQIHQWKMWYYFVAHCAYHFTRWFPKDARGKVRITVILFALSFIIPQLYVVQVEQTGNGFCDEPLLNITVAGIVFTFAMIAFTFLFAIMEPVPWQLKIAFHFFGFGSLILGMVLFASTLATLDCKEFSPELYYLCLSLGIFSVLSTGFLIIMLPFWLVNYLWPDSVLNRRERRGVCYEPVKCCTCLWHI